MSAVPVAPAPSFRRACWQEAFERDGFVVVDLLDDRDLAGLRATWRDVGSGGPAYPFASTIMSGDLAHRAEVHRRVADVLGPRVHEVVDGFRLCLGSFAAKRAGEHSEVQVHQDWSFVDERRYWSIGLWCPLVDVDPCNGCLQVLPGSHLVNRGARGANQAFAYPEAVGAITAHHLVEVPMTAGQALVTTQSLIHASPPNRSGASRVAACALAVPDAAQLRFVAGGGADGGTLRVYGVEDDFYVRHPYGTEPSPELLVEAVDVDIQPLHLGALAPTGRRAVVP